MGRDSRIAMVRLGADSKSYLADLRSAERATQTWGNRVKGHISKSLRGGFGSLSGITGLAGVAGFGAAARAVMKFNEGLVDLQISSGKSRGEMLAFNRSLQQTAAATGAQQEELIAGAQKYTELTGKFEEFASSMDTFAKASVATGATMEELVAASAALSTNLGVGPEQMLGALDAITAMGKSGKIEIKDLAAELPGLTGQFATFGTTGAEGVLELSAAMQIMARGFGSASETATGMQALMTAVVQNAGKLKGIGVDVFTKGPGGVNQLRDFKDIVFQLVEKSKGDPKVLQKVLGRQEALQALLPLMAAGSDEFEKFISIGEKGGTVMADFAEKEKSVGVQMRKAKAQLDAAVNDALLKNLDGIVIAFQALVKALAWMASHPEAMIALAALWKGGGFLGGLGALGGAAGGGGMGGLTGGAAGVDGGRGARMAGGMMQGAAAGLLLSQMAPQVGGALDTIDTFATTAAGALAMLPGPLGMAAKAAMGLKLAFDIASADITRQQDAEAKKKQGTQHVNQRTNALIGSGRMQSKATEVAPGDWRFLPEENKANEHDRRVAAQDAIRELYQGGAGTTVGGKVSFNPTLARTILEQNNPNMQPGEIDRLLQAAAAGRDLLNSDTGRSAPFVREIDPANAPHAPGNFSAGADDMSLPFNERFAAPVAPEEPSWFQGAIKKMSEASTVKVELAPGMVLVEDKSNRRKGR